MAEKPKKTQKLKARLPRGLADRGPAEIAATRAMVEKIREVYERYGFEPVETPAFEFTDALGKFLPDQDRPNEGVFSFQDDDEQWISLRYDLTAPLARYVAENFDSLPKPYRSYRAGYVYRNEKPGPGRFRQFMQFDADTVGSASPAADAEMCMMAADTMEALGIPRGSYVVKVSSRKVLDGVMEAIGLGKVEDANKRLIVLRAIDKFDRLGFRGVGELLGPGRKDESGDFTKGADLNTKQISIIRSLFNMSPSSSIQPAEEEGQPIIVVHFNDDMEGRTDRQISNAQTLDYMEAHLPFNPTFKQGITDLAEIASLVAASGYGSDRIVIDPAVVRGLEYYTGPVYEVELLLETNDEKGRPVRFGSVGGGGRYDGLVSRFRGEPVPATGFSIGVSRLQAALTMLGKLDTTPEFGPVVVTVFDRDRIADYQKMVASLRGAKIRAELYLGNPKNMGNQLKYADRRNSPCVIIQGSDEKARGEVQIKDLIEGAKAAAAIASNQEWRESRPAQFSCSEAELVARVREVLARHGVKWGIDSTVLIEPATISMHCHSGARALASEPGIHNRQSGSGIPGLCLRFGRGRPKTHPGMTAEYGCEAFRIR
jgi:histidyl-tRNA synthetase